MTTMFLGHTVDYWIRLKRDYEDLQNLLNTPEGQLLSVKGEMIRKREQITTARTEVKDLEEEYVKLSDKYFKLKESVIYDKKI